MKDFDTILGRDWLGRNYVIILYHEKEVLFQEPGYEEFQFFGTRTLDSTPIGVYVESQKDIKKEYMSRIFIE